MRYMWLHMIYSMLRLQFFRHIFLELSDNISRWIVVANNPSPIRPKREKEYGKSFVLWSKSVLKPQNAIITCERRQIPFRCSFSKSAGKSVPRWVQNQAYRNWRHLSRDTTYQPADRPSHPCRRIERYSHHISDSVDAPWCSYREDAAGC